MRSMSDDRYSTQLPMKVPVLILNGFLGSGKTTRLRSLIVQSLKKNLSIAVVVNELSKLDVDALIVETSGSGHPMPML